MLLLRDIAAGRASHEASVNHARIHVQISAIPPMLRPIRLEDVEEEEEEERNDRALASGLASRDDL